MAQTKSLSDFKSTLRGGGARPNLFEVSIPDFPGAVRGEGVWNNTAQRDLTFMCKAAQLPASTVASVPVAFRGRELKVAGERTFDPWVITIINDEDFRIRTAMEAWANKLSKLNDATGVTNPGSYMTDAYVQQLGRGAEKYAARNDGGESSVLRTYRFYDIWPSAISAIDLSYDTTNTVEEFTVEFQVQYFSIGEGPENATSADNDGSDSGEEGQTIIR